MVYLQRYTKGLKSALLLVCFLLFNSLEAQELHPISKFTPQQYNGENQNWAMSQAEDKTIYVANNLGLLEYNGAQWTRYNSPNETILRSVKVVGDKIYTGCYMEFGYWKKNSFGILEYTSLSKNKSITIVEDEQFWQITALDNWVVFCSLNKIYIYNTQDETFKTLESESLLKLYKVDDAVYFQDFGIGIFKIINGKKTLFLDNDIAKNTVIVNMFYHQGQLMLLTENKGFFILKNEKLTPWTPTLNQTLSNYSVYSSIKLKDEGFALGTISNGVIILNNEGKITETRNQNLGLSTNTVLSVFEDKDLNIWLGLDNGINCINIKTPIKTFNDSKGELGSVYASAFYNNNLYLGTNQGLFYRNSKETSDAFTFIEGTKGQVWCLEVIDNELFCGHNSGTYLISNNKAKQITNIQGTWSIKAIQGKPNTLIQGNYNGLNILEKSNNNWHFKNKIEGFDISSRFFEIIKGNTIFVNHEYKGVYKININQSFTKALKVEKKPISKGLHSGIYKYNNQVYYVYKDGFYKYNFNKNEFEKDEEFSQIFKPSNYTSGKLIHDTNFNSFWTFTNTEIIHVKPGKLSNKPEINKIALPQSLRNSVTSFENIIQLNGSEYLIGTSSGYLIIDIKQINRKPENITINKVASNTFNKNPKTLNLFKNVALHPNENNIEISYSIKQFNKFNVVEYQHQLQGIYNQWSSWSTIPNVRYKNLPSGDYTFNVRAKVGQDVTNSTAYSFNIKKPWYASNLALVIYCLCFILLALLLHYFYRSYYKKQREKLLRKAQRDLELKELEYKQQQMHFENQQLQQDVDSKSRELAISTMSLIKKNEFLNSIKTELNTKGSESNIKSVINIIDKNINNTDDWKFFQEAFNNADKDFLKKLKSEHSTLTPNDLKLCAYLRLNLSSKEIAPLLNISPRSVEVKRYRLRKKMNLSHETSLANYIIEL